jgi:hypothetical protein
LKKSLDLGPIQADADKAEQAGASNLEGQLVEKLDAVDLLIADLGQMSEFNASAQSFVNAATKEIDWNRWARLAVILVAGLMITGLALLVREVLFSTSLNDLRQSPTAFSTVIAASIGGGVILAIGVTRAVFSTFGERNDGVPMPEQLRQVIEVAKILKP